MACPVCPWCDRPLRRGVEPIFGLFIEWCASCDLTRLAADPSTWWPTSTRFEVLRDHADHLISIGETHDRF